MINENRKRTRGENCPLCDGMRRTKGAETTGQVSEIKDESITRTARNGPVRFREAPLNKAAMVEWLRSLTRNRRVLCSNLSSVSHGTTLDKSLTVKLSTNDSFHVSHSCWSNERTRLHVDKSIITAAGPNGRKHIGHYCYYQLNKQSIKFV